MKNGAKKEDRRIGRTKRALISALVELVLEKRYANVTIQNLLDRAKVGRATFYSHYRGKDDLLLRSFEGLLEMLNGYLEPPSAKGARLAPVRELFEHVASARRFHQALERAHMLDQLFRAGTECLSNSIESRLATRQLDCNLPKPVLARALAGSLFSLLAWWLGQETHHTPEQMDEMFHRIHGLD
jgi:AcrR family transcriptional regulator